MSGHHVRGALAVGLVLACGCSGSPKETSQERQQRLEQALNMAQGNLRALLERQPEGLTPSKAARHVVQSMNI